ncbi:AAA family ATPase [Acidaminococcus fermentans]|uniref:AAA family ATPase n=1 Tax=Acidaminococcus fermentans TaxID=905 RepID=UPI003F88B416
MRYSMKNKYYIKKLWFTGPEIEDSSVEFINGLNIIHGANDTGKSWILDSFDFMCGMDYDNFVIHCHTQYPKCNPQD